MNDGDTINDSEISDGQQRTIVRVAQTCASLSLLGSAVIVVAYFRFKQLVVWLAVCDLVVNLNFFVGSPRDGSGLCYMQGVLQQFFQVALIQWTLLIAQSLLVMTSTTRTFDGDKRMPWNHLWAWGVSTLLSVAPLSTSSFGKTESSFCGVDSGDSWNVGSLWRAIFLVVVFISMVAIVWTYVEVVQELGRAQNNVSRMSLHATATRSKEASVKQQEKQQRRPRSHGGESSVAFNIMSQPSSANPNARPPVSFGQSRKGMEIPTVDQEMPTEPTNDDSTLEGTVPKIQGWRRDSFLKRMILGSIVESVEEERRPSIAVSPQSARHRLQRRSSSSSIFWARSNSNISVKDWLWSTSRDMGFSGDNKALDACSPGGEERKNVLWLNGMTSPTKRRLSSGVAMHGLITTASPEIVPLGVLRETERGNRAGGGGSVSAGEVSRIVRDADGAIHQRPTSSTRSPTIKWEQFFSKLGVPAEVPSSANGNVRNPVININITNAPSSCLPHGHGRSDLHTRLFKDAIPSNRRAEAADSSSTHNSHCIMGATMMTTRQMHIKSRLATGVASARGYVRRMSSLDTDHGDVAFGNYTVRTGRLDLADRDKGDKMSSNRFAATSMAPQGARGGRGWQALTKRAPEMDMDRFISRIKWYPVIYVLCWTFTLINGIYTMTMGQSNGSFSLVLLATFTSRLQGLLNFICYGLNDKLKQAWLQDFAFRRAVASCCRALWCCCFGPCYRGEDDDDGDGEADQTRQTKEVAQGSSVPNSLGRMDPADEMERGTAAGAGPKPRPGSITSPPTRPASLTSPPFSGRSRTAIKTSSIATYATPTHNRRQERSTLAPARPSRPIRKAPSGAHSPSWGNSAAATGRRKKSVNSTASTTESVRRQRAAVVSRARASSHGGRASHRSPARKLSHHSERSRQNRRYHIEQQADRNGGKSGHNTSNTVTTVGPKLSPALPISVSMPLKAAPRKSSVGQDAAVNALSDPRPFRPRNGRNKDQNGGENTRSGRDLGSRALSSASSSSSSSLSYDSGTTSSEVSNMR